MSSSPCDFHMAIFFLLFISIIMVDRDEALWVGQGISLCVCEGIIIMILKLGLTFCNDNQEYS